MKYPGLLPFALGFAFLAFCIAFDMYNQYVSHLHLVETLIRINAGS